MDDIKMLIAFNLQYFRKTKRLTQNTVSKLLNIDKSSLSKYETGVSEPSFTTLQRLADLYECQIVDFFGGQKSKSLKLDPIDEHLIQEIKSLPEPKKASLYRIFHVAIDEMRKN